MKRVVLIVGLLLIVGAACASAQAVGGTEIAVGTLTVSKTGHDREEFIFARLLAWIRYERFNVAFRVEASGIPGTFNHEDPGTYRSARIGVATNWDLLFVQDAACGPMLGAEYSAILETKDGVTPQTEMPATFGVGVACRYRGNHAYAILGPNQALKGWLSGTVVAHIPAGWSSWTMEAGLGKRQQALVMISVAAKFDTGGKR